MQFSNKPADSFAKVTLCLLLLLLFASAACPPTGSTELFGLWNSGGGCDNPAPGCSSSKFYGANMCSDGSITVFNPYSFGSWTGSSTGGGCESHTWPAGYEAIGIDTYINGNGWASGMKVYTKNAAGSTITYDYSVSNKHTGPSYIALIKPVVGFRVVSCAIVDQIFVYVRDACARMTWTTVSPASIADITTYINTKIVKDLTYHHDLENIWSEWGAITLSLSNPGPAILKRDPISGQMQLVIQPVNLLTDIGTWTVTLNVEVDWCEEVSKNKHIAFVLTVLPECNPAPYFPADYTKQIGYSVGQGPTLNPAIFVRTDCPYLEMTYGITSAPPPKVTATLFTMSGTNLVINTVNAGDVWTYTVTIEYYTNKVPIGKSAEPIIFTVTVTVVPCALSVWADQAWETTVPAITFKMHDATAAAFSSLSTSGIFTFSAFTYSNPSNTFCGDPVYSLDSSTIWTNQTGTLSEQDLLTLATRTLTVWSDNSTDVGTHWGNYLYVSYPDVSLIGLTRKIEFSVKITSVCLDADIEYIQVLYLHHPLKTTNPPTEYDILSELTDDISRQSAQLNGINYCGPYVLLKQNLVRLGSSSTDQSVLDFSDGSPIYFDATSEAQFGWYNLTFTVGLVNFPDFVPQTRWLKFEIVPNCVDSEIQVPDNYQIVFKGAPQLSSQTKTLISDFWHTMNTTYNGYCNPIEFIVTPTLFDDSNISLDGGVLKIAPDSSVTPGVFDFVLEARLKNFTSVVKNVPFSVVVSKCIVSNFYANGTSDDLTLSSISSRVLLTTTLTYVIGIDNEKQVGLEFNDFVFDPVQSLPGCHDDFVQSFEIAVDGETTIPDWLIPGGYDERFFTISTVNSINVGTHTVQVQATINTVYSVLSVTNHTFTVYIKVDPCYNVEIISHALDDMSFMIESRAVPTTQVFDLFTLSLPLGSDCGQLTYNLVGSLVGSAVILDSDNHSISVFTTNGLHVGKHTYTLEVYMARYSILKVTRGKFVDFEVEIDSVCLHTSINSFDYPETVYQLKEPAKIVSGILHSDVESLDDGSGNGYSLCGLRTFTSSNPSYFTVPATGNIISMAVKFPDNTKSYQYISYTDPPLNVKYPVSITVGLFEYPQIAPQTFNFNLYVAAACATDGVAIFQQGNFIILETSVKAPVLSSEVPFCTAYTNDALASSGVRQTDNLSFCGQCNVELVFLNVTYPDGTTNQGIQNIPKWVQPIYDTNIGLLTNVKFKPVDAVDIGKYFFVLEFSLAEYPLVRPGKVIIDLTVTATSSVILSGHPPTVSMSEECFKWQVPLGKSFSVTFVMDDPDPGEVLTWKVEGSAAIMRICKSCFNWFSVTGSWIQTVKIDIKPELVGYSTTLKLIVQDSTKQQAEVVFIVNAVGKDQEMKSLCDEEAEVVVTPVVQEIVLTNTTNATENSTETTNSTEADKKALTEFMSKYAIYFEMGNLESPEMLKILADFPLPIPFIKELDAQGLMVIRITKEIIIPTISDMIPFLYMLHEDELITINLCSSETGLCLKGNPVFNETTFRAVNSNITYPEYTNRTQRELRGGLSNTFEYQTTATYEVKDDSPVEIERNFNWTVERYQGKQINIRMSYSAPVFISSPVWDDTKVVMNNAQEFLIVPGSLKATPNGFNMKKAQPRQMSAAVEAAIRGSGNTARYAMQIMTVGNILLAMLMNTGLQTLWSGINALQFTIHLPVYSLYFPPNVMVLFEKLIAIVTFDIVDTLQALGIDDPIAVTKTAPWNNNFNELRYDNSNTYQNLGSLNYIMWVIAGQTLFFFVTRPACLRRSKIGAKMQGKLTGTGIFNTWTRFWLEAFFDTLMAVLITLVPGEQLSLLDMNRDTWTVGDTFTYYYTLILLAVIGCFVIFVVIAVATCLKKVVNRNKEDRHRENIDKIGLILKTRLERLKEKDFSDLVFPEAEALNNESQLLVQPNDINDVQLERKKVTQGQSSENFEQTDTEAIFSARKISAKFFLLEERDLEGNEELVIEEELPSPPEQLEIKENVLNPLFFFNEDIKLQSEQMPPNEVQENSMMDPSKETENSERKQQESHYEFLETFTEGMNLISNMATGYHVSFLFRRIAFVFAAFWLVREPAFQVQLFVQIQLFSLLFLLSFQVFEELQNQRLEMMNELFVYIAGLHVIVLLLHKDDTEFCVDVGWSFIGCIALNLVINMAIAFKTMVGGLKQSILNFKTNLASKQAAFDRFDCLCSCAHCGKNADFEKRLVLDQALNFSIKLSVCEQESAFDPERKMGKLVAFTRQELEKIERREKEDLTNRVFTAHETTMTAKGAKQLRLKQEQTLESAPPTKNLRIKVCKDQHK